MKVNACDAGDVGYSLEVSMSQTKTDHLRQNTVCGRNNDVCRAPAAIPHLDMHALLDAFCGIGDTVSEKVTRGRPYLAYVARSPCSEMAQAAAW